MKAWRRRVEQPHPGRAGHLPRPPLVGGLMGGGLALGAMFAFGGLQGVVVLALPHWEVTHPGLVLATSLTAIALAPVVWLLRRRLAASRHAVLGLGALLVSLGVLGCGPQPSSMGAGYLYFWLVLYAAALFPARTALAHVAGIGLLYAGALALNPVEPFLSQWLQGMTALAVTAAVVSGFSATARRTSAELTYVMLHDELTGLGNRAYFMQQVDQALCLPHPSTERVAVLLLDLDDFKRLNDSLGHRTGDQLLAAVAQRLESLVSADDVFARLGGDEFAMLLTEDVLSDRAEDTARVVVQALETPFSLEEREVTVSASIGIAFAARPDSTADELMREADMAMYHAKKSGKGRFEVVRPGMKVDADTYITLVTDLRRALAASQFEVFYQPCVRVRDIRPVGAEALIRWHHPERGRVPPLEFIGAAESTGLIVSIGEWVLNEACRQTEAWRRSGAVDDDFYVTVNFSPRQLAEPDIVATVAAALRRSSLPPHALVLEITESMLMLDFEAGLKRLHALKALGVRLALDDYGTGYSSLHRLRRLPVDIVKIDKSFIDRLGGDNEVAKILVRSVIDVTHGLGMISIAEGVERRAQYAVLDELGCDAIQGYLFAGPAPNEETARAVERLAAAGSNGMPHPA